MTERFIVSYDNRDDTFWQYGDDENLEMVGREEAEFEYYFYEGCMTLPNGDPGYPDEEGVDQIGDVDFYDIAVVDRDNNKVDIEIDDTLLKEFKQFLEEELYRKVNNGEYEIHRGY